MRGNDSSHTTGSTQRFGGKRLNAPVDVVKESKADKTDLGFRKKTIEEEETSVRIKKKAKGGEKKREINRLVQI